MYTLITLIIIISIGADAQTQPFGKVDTADLKLSACDFEKGANAEVLFSKCDMHIGINGIKIQYHKRIKIFNMAAHDLGDVSVNFVADNLIESVSDLQAETFNLVDGKITVTKVDKQSFYKRKNDRWMSHYSFSFPDMRAGSIIEYSYSRFIHYTYDPPSWCFQDKIPVRYSECRLAMPKVISFKTRPHVTQPLLTNTDTLVAMRKILSLPEEPFMSSYESNLQSVSFIFVSGDGSSGKVLNTDTTWQQTGASLIYNPGYGQQLKNRLDGEDRLIDATRNMTAPEKIAFIFNKVRDTMKCDDDYPTLYIHQQLNLAWKFRSGNASDMNMILCRLLSQVGISTRPVAVSMDKDDRVEPDDVRRFQFDRTIAYAMVNDRHYILDASSKENQWFIAPQGFLNTYGLYMDVNASSAGLIFLEDNAPSKDMVLIDAELTPEGTMNGNAMTNSFGYSKTNELELYKTLGEKKYSEYLCDGNNNLHIDSIGLQNILKDTLPLIRNIRFALKLQSADEQYIYFSPNQFTLLKDNPFLSESRYSAVDLNFRRDHILSGRFKIPPGYTAYAIPKNTSLLTPDKSISFKRIVDVQNGYVVVHYSINYNKSYFLPREYPGLREFYKKMYDMLNEEIVLKKT